MTAQPEPNHDATLRQHVALAAVRGLISGVVRAAAAWLFDRYL